MSSQYEELKKELHKQLESIESNQAVMSVINMKLPNSSNETDDDKWSEGSRIFASNNKQVFDEWLKTND